MLTARAWRQIRKSSALASLFAYLSMSSAVERLPGEAAGASALAIEGSRISETFLYGPAESYAPVIRLDG